MEYKICKTCKSMLPTSEFYKHKLTKDGLYIECKECCKKRAKKFYNAKKKEKEEKANSVPSSKKECVEVNTRMVALKEYTPRELIEALRERGYKGELHYTHKIIV